MHGFRFLFALWYSLPRPVPGAAPLGQLLANGIACSSVTYAHFIYKLAAKWKIKNSERLRGMQCHLNGQLLFAAFYFYPFFFVYKKE